MLSIDRPGRTHSNLVRKLGPDQIIFYGITTQNQLLLFNLHDLTQNLVRTSPYVRIRSPGPVYPSFTSSSFLWLLKYQKFMQNITNFGYPNLKLHNPKDITTYIVTTSQILERVYTVVWRPATVTNDSLFSQLVSFYSDLVRNLNPGYKFGKFLTTCYALVVKKVIDEK